MFAYIWKFDYFLGGVEMTFVFFVIFHAVEEVREMLYFGARYWWMTGNLVDLLQTVVCIKSKLVNKTGRNTYFNSNYFQQAFYSCAFLGIRAMFYEHWILKLVRINRGHFTNFERLTSWQWLYTKFTATLYFQAIIKLFKYLHFTPYMSQLVLVVQRVSGSLLAPQVLEMQVYCLYLYAYAF